MLRLIFVFLLSLQLAAGFNVKYHRSNLNMNMDSFKESLKQLKKIAAPAVIGAALLSSPFVQSAEAISSGARSGGSSFKSSPSRSYSSGPSRSYSTRLNSGYSSPNIIIAPPVFSPFGYGYGGFGFGMMPVNFNLLLLGLGAYAVITFLSNRVGGSDFSDSSVGALGSGSTVLKIQIGLDSSWAPGNVMESLGNVAAQSSNSLSSRNGLSNLLSNTALTLLRKQNDWNSVAFEGSFFRENEYREAEPLFQKIAISERSKFEKESSSVATIKPSSSGASTQAVVSIVVAFRGKAKSYMNSVRSTTQLRECLQNLAADALTDDGENVMAVELLWTPSEADTVISERDIVLDYPELVRL